MSGRVLQFPGWFGLLIAVLMQRLDTIIIVRQTWRVNLLII